MVEVSEAEATALAEQSKLAAAEGLTRILEVLADAEMRLRDAASKKILIEVALLKAIEARNALSVDSVLKQLQDLRDGKGGGPAALKPSAAPAPARTTPSALSEPKSVLSRTQSAASSITPAVIREQPAGAVSPEPAGDLAELWAKVLEAVGRASPFTRSYLLEAHPVSLQKNLFTIGFDPEFEDHIGLVDNARNHTLLQTKLSELGHPGLQFKFIKAEAPAAAGTIPAKPVELPPSAPASKAPPQAPASKAVSSQPPPSKEKLAAVPFNKDDFKNDPLIQRALKLFKGQIVEVRA